MSNSIDLLVKGTTWGIATALPEVSHWTLQEGLLLIRQIEPIAVTCGWHTALGGGVLIRGESEHDVDVIVYPRTPVKPHGICIPMDLLGQIAYQLPGFVNPHSRSKIKKGSGGSSEQSKSVYAGTFEGKRVDFIFLLPDILRADL